MYASGPNYPINQWLNHANNNNNYHNVQWKNGQMGYNYSNDMFSTSYSQWGMRNDNPDRNQNYNNSGNWSTWPHNSMQTSNNNLGWMSFEPQPEIYYGGHYNENYTPGKVSMQKQLQKRQHRSDLCDRCKWLGYFCGRDDDTNDYKIKNNRV